MIPKLFWLLGLCFWREGRGDRSLAEQMGEKGRGGHQWFRNSSLQPLSSQPLGGTITTFIPADWAARTPASLSSKTTQALGSTLRRRAASR